MQKGFFMNRIITIITAVTLILSFVPTAVYAKETDMSTAIELHQETEGTPGEATGLLQDETSVMLEGGTEEITEDVGKAPDSGIGEIISFEPLEKTEYSFEYQIALASLVSKLPDSLTVRTADGIRKINVKWICERDYNEVLDEYPFVPDMEGCALAKGIELPRITVTFTREHREHVNGHRRVTDIGYEIPFVTDEMSLDKASKLPSYLNRFEAGELPPVRDQGQTGTCWAHGTIGAMEADLIQDKKETTEVDLSEWHLAYYFYNPYKDPKGCRKDTVSYPDGTDYLQYGSSENYAVRVLFNQVGAIPDHYAHINPGYEPTDPEKFKPGKSFVISKDTAQLRNAYYINPKDIKSIKTAVYEHGGAAFGFYVHDWYKDEELKYYNSTNSAYYCPDDQEPNHTVMIVGWDDDFSKDNFTYTPKGNGAWLVRNSWGGQDYCEDGYFWLSYYDKSFCMDGCPVVAVDADNVLYQNCYASDGNQFFTIEGMIDPDDSIEVRYKVSAHEKVEAVGVEVTSASANVKAVVKNLSTGQTESGKIKTSTAGLYTIVLSNPVEVYKESDIEVSISGSSGNGKPLGLGFEEPGEEKVYQTFDYKTVVDRGYYSDGKKYKDFDARIKLYTNASDAKYTKVTGVTLNKNKSTVKDGKTLKLTATVKPKGATYKFVKWSSSNEKVATVSDKGVVKALSPGKATIKCKTYDQGMKATCKITVEKVPLEDVSLRSKASVYKGKTITLVPEFKPKNASNKKVTWSSDDEEIATVDKNGKVTGKSPGKAYITVRTEEGGMKATCAVMVEKPVKVEKIKLDKRSKTLNVGDTFKLKVTIKPKDATEKGVKWKSSNTSVATVDKNGKVKALKAGTAKITATSKGNNKKKDTCKITVKSKDI